MLSILYYDLYQGGYVLPCVDLFFGWFVSLSVRLCKKIQCKLGLVKAVSVVLGDPGRHLDPGILLNDSLLLGDTAIFAAFAEVCPL